MGKKKAKPKSKKVSGQKKAKPRGVALGSRFGAL